MNTTRIYLPINKSNGIEVLLAVDTIWLTISQMAELFKADTANITQHLANVFADGELERDSSVAQFTFDAVEAVDYYSLDAIISVGYRINGKVATHFRKWASGCQKDDISKQNSNGGEQTDGLLKVLNDYAFALDVLDQYDHQTLEIQDTEHAEAFRLDYTTGMQAIEKLKDLFGGSDLFGNEKDDSFQGSVDALYQTFDGVELYPNVEVKAAHLLYFVVKNHSFSDGNKRIAAFLFVWFLERNGLLYNKGSKVIDDNTLVALTLMIAASKSDDKAMMIKVVTNLINNRKG